MLEDSTTSLNYFFVTIPKEERHSRTGLQLSQYLGFFIAALYISSHFMDMLTSYTWGRSAGRDGQGRWNAMVLPTIVAGCISVVALGAMVLSVSYCNWSGSWQDAVLVIPTGSTTRQSRHFTPLPLSVPVAVTSLASASERRLLLRLLLLLVC